ncbi:hypothetical protein GOP47_0005324 [Adiantum capillus-veneris]|uniref:Uncharacterized protein n=1 Tax=Adiantum capillus-veneris TaxID=13818 RepID=A0A9D4V4W3_ADICA|nr:hypothetical protein GOP47_0005324 [Adiantum capillus-veneris]
MIAKYAGQVVGVFVQNGGKSFLQLLNRYFKWENPASHNVLELRTQVSTILYNWIVHCNVINSFMIFRVLWINALCFGVHIWSESNTSSWLWIMRPSSPAVTSQASFIELASHLQVLLLHRPASANSQAIFTCSNFAEFVGHLHLL